MKHFTLADVTKAHKNTYTPQTWLKYGANIPNRRRLLVRVSPVPKIPAGMESMLYSNFMFLKENFVLQILLIHGFISLYNWEIIP